MKSPVVLLIFNRPDCLAQVLAVVRGAQPERLFVVADGPRPNHPRDRQACADARHAVEVAIDWPCDLRRNYAETNLGCAQRVSSGLTWVFSQVEQAIVLEDDCVPEPSFFPFCAELLERYRDDERIAQIAGSSFQPASAKHTASYFFSRYPHCWGWATWRRSWQHYDHAMTGWPTAEDETRLARTIENPIERRLWSNCFDATAAGRTDSWAYRWTLSVWRRNALTVLPYSNLVSNIGFGDAATHTRRANAAAARPVASMSFPLVHPAAVERDGAADDYTSKLLFRPASLWVRVARRIGAVVRR